MEPNTKTDYQTTSTRCKFACTFVKEHENGTKEISLSPVYSGSDENKKFWEYTPGGRLDFYTVNKNVKIEQGKEYYIDISPAS